MVRLAFSDRYIYELPEGHRFPIRKYQMIMDALIRDQIIFPEQVYDPGLADEEILLAHDPIYYKNVLNLKLSDSEIRNLGVPLHTLSVARARNSVAGTLRSAEQATATGLGITIGGGYHHAFADHGEGFCIFNDLAIAARFLLKHTLARKILVLDLDVHQGNGTAHICAGDPGIFTFSMHGQKNYPAKKERSSLDIELADGTSNEDYLVKLEQGLDQVFQTNTIDLILYQAGVDVLASDQLGRLALTLEGCRRRDYHVFNRAQKMNIPVVVTLGGGYSKDISTIVQAHVNTILSAFEVLG